MSDFNSDLEELREKLSHLEIEARRLSRLLYGEELVEELEEPDWYATRLSAAYDGLSYASEFLELVKNWLDYE